MLTIIKGVSLVLLGAGLTQLTTYYFDESQPEVIPRQFTQPLIADQRTTSQQSATDSGNKTLTLRQIMELVSDFEQTAELYQLIRHMDVEGLNRLLAEAASLSQVSQRLAAASILFARYAEADPIAALKRANSQSTRAENRWIASIFHNWSRTDLEAAVEYAATLSKALMQMAGSAILNARDDLSPIERETIAKTLEVTSVLARIDLRNRNITFAGDPQGAWADAVNISDSQKQLQTLQALSMQWAQQDPEAALAAIGRLDNQRLSSMNHSIVQQWAQKDPFAALNWITTLPAGSQHAQMLNSTISVIASQDLPQAIRWADTQTGSVRTQATRAIAQSWINQDVEAARAWITSLNDPNLSQSVIPNIASAYANYSLERAYEWVETLSTEHSAQAVQMLVSIEANSDPEQAAQRISKYQDSNTWQLAATNLVQTWGRRNPSATIAWLDRQKGQERSKLYQALATQWAYRDSQAAISALRNTIDDAYYDAAALGVMQALGDSPEQAEEIFQDIKESAYKTQAAGILYRAWRQRGELEKAEKYLNQSQYAKILASNC